jgi:hypothetical protein
MKNCLQSVKDFLLGAMVVIAVLALFMGVRFALFVPLHNETMAAKDPAPIAAADAGCVVTARKMHCPQGAKQEVQAIASGPRHSGSAGGIEQQTSEEQNTRCAARQVKFPCFEQTDRSS